MNNSSMSNYGGYRDICKQAAANDDVFASFKQNGEYRRTLEHVNKDNGLMYLSRVVTLKQLSPDDIVRAKSNDEQGTPTQETYDEPFGIVAPSTIRYMSVLSEIMSHVGDLTQFTIVEIGGGYGGQCKLIGDKFNVKEYHIYDLPEPLALMRRYHKIWLYKHYIS